MRRAKPLAKWIDCPGLANRYEHSMRDHCWNCAPWWERYPVCPVYGHGRLTDKGKCVDCRKYYDLEGVRA